MQWSWHEFLVFSHHFQTQMKCQIFYLLNVCVCMCVQCKNTQFESSITWRYITIRIQCTVSQNTCTLKRLVEWSLKQLFRDVYHLICFLKWKFHVCSTCICECVMLLLLLFFFSYFALSPLVKLVPWIYTRVAECWNVCVTLWAI